MGFAQEMKEFVSAAQAGWKMMTPTPADVGAARLAEEKRQAAVKEAAMNEPGLGGAKGRPGVEGGGGGGSGSGSGSGSGGGSGGGGSEDTATDPVAEDLKPQEKALLNAISGPESAGKYNVRYTPDGGTTFDETGEHPAIPEPIKGSDQKSTAAGRYQFVKKTWDRVAGDLPFTRENQDRMALKLARQDYNARTGRNLDADLSARGLTPGIMKALAPTWEGFKSGDGQSKAARIYASSLDRYAEKPDTTTTASADDGSAAMTVAPASTTRTARRPPAVPVVPEPPVRPASVTPGAIPIRRVRTTPASAVSVDQPVAIDSATGQPIDPNDPRINPDIQSRPVVPGRTSAIGLYPEDDPYLRSGIYAAKGGLVPGYASGGAVEDLNQEDLGGDVGSTGNAADDEAMMRGGSDNPLAYIRLAANKGLSQIQERFGLGSGAVPEESPRAQDGARALAVNAGAPNPEDIQTLMKTAPTGLTDDQKAVYVWGNLIKYHAAHDNPQGVANAGAAMLMHSKRVSQAAGALALAAMEKGDYDTATRAIQRAYNTFPDGQTVKVNTSGPDGIEYEIVGQDGVGKNGKITPEELKQLAQGMMDGSQWFQHATQLTQMNIKPADLAKQRRARARSDFEETEMDEKGFIGTLSEDGKKKFLKMDPADKKEFMQRHLRESENQAKQDRFNERNTLMAERDEIKAGRMQDRDARKEDMTLFKEALKQGRWEATRDQVMTNFERMAALRERDLGDRMIRHKESLDARQKRYADYDRKIMERTRGIGEKGAKLTAPEAREQRRLEGEQTAEERLTSAVESQTPLEPTGASEGAMQAQREQKVAGVVEPIRAGGAYARIPPKDRAVDEGDFTDIRKIIDDSPAWKAAKGLDEPHKLWAARIAADVHATAGGKLRKEDAVSMVQSAINPKNPEPRVNPATGAVKIVPNLPEVNLSTESMVALNNLRRATAGTLRQEEASRFPTASRVAPTGPAVPGAVDLEQQRGEIAARRAAEGRGAPAIDLGRLRDTLMPPVDRVEAVRQAAELQRRDEERRRRQRAIGNIR